jgi:hypothetical protein
MAYGTTLPVNSTHRIRYYLTLDGAGKPNLIPRVSIFRDSDSTFLQYNETSFAAAPAEIPMSPLNSSIPGAYFYDFDQSADGSSRLYTVRVRVTASSGSVLKDEFFEIEFGGAVGSAALPGEDFGGMILRKSYDRNNRGYKAVFRDAFGIGRKERMTRILNSKKRSTNPIDNSATQAGGGGSSPFS